MSAFEFNHDESFHYETLRQVGHATYHGSDVKEVLTAAGQLRDKGGDFEAFHDVFLALAERVERYAGASQANTCSQRISRRDAYFRAATYYRAADFYLHGDADSKRINSLWEKQTKCFNTAIALLSRPGRRETLKSADGSFSIPVTFYATDPAEFPGPRPTIITGNGFDGAEEEMLHVCGFAALERGFNVVTYEGPGQPRVRRDQGLGFIHDWERVVTPVVDWLFEHEEKLQVDTGKLGLWGYSMGGFLASRAAAFEHRIAAVLAVDGIFDVGEMYTKAQPPHLKALYEKGDKAAFDEVATQLFSSSKTPTSLRWGLSHGAWSMCDEADGASVYGMMKLSEKMTLSGIADKIQCPVFVGDAESDIFFQGQAGKLAHALGDRATYILFSAEDSAEAHCQVGAGQYLNQTVFDWFEKVVEGKS